MRWWESTGIEVQYVSFAMFSEWEGKRGMLVPQGDVIKDYSYALVLLFLGLR